MSKLWTVDYPSGYDGRMLRPLAIAVLLLAPACVGDRTFWDYAVDTDVHHTLPDHEELAAVPPVATSPHNLKVVHSDGATQTETIIPILTSSQTVIIEPTTPVNPQTEDARNLAPAASDRALGAAYAANGQRAGTGADVSMVETRKMVAQLVKAGDYRLALTYLDKLLIRYPAHAESLRTKGSLHLAIGEKSAALEAYRKAEAVEHDPKTAGQIAILEAKGTSETEQ